MSKGINYIIRHLITVTQKVSRSPYQQHTRHQLTLPLCMALLRQLASLPSLWKKEHKKKEKYSSATSSGSLDWDKVLETTKRNQPLILGHNYTEQVGRPSKEIPICCRLREWVSPWSPQELVDPELPISVLVYSQGGAQIPTVRISQGTNHILWSQGEV